MDGLAGTPPLSPLGRSVRWALQRARPHSGIDPTWSTTSLLSWATKWTLDACRGLVVLTGVPGHPIRFCERGVSVEGRRNCSFGRWLLLERGVTIRARGGGGVQLGERVVIGSYSVLEVTSGLARNRGQIRLGRRSSLGDYCYVGGAGSVTIGENVLCGQYVSFHSENHRFDDLSRPIREQGVTNVGISVGDDCWIGAGATILDGVAIGEGSVVAAGAVVNRAVPPGSVVAGVPARIIARRGATVDDASATGSP